MFVGSGESMVAMLELEGINERALPRVEPAAQLASTRENSPGLDTVRIDRLIALLDFTGGAAWPFSWLVE